MDEIIKFLKEQKTDYDIGIINNGYYYKLKTPFKDKQVIRFKWKRNSVVKLINKLNKKEIKLIPYSIGKYSGLYDIEGTLNQAFIIYAVDSHVQLPKLLLKNFRTNEHLYYINTSSNTIKRSSASNYNTKFGYYSLFFEDYLSKNYEKIIVDIMDAVTPFINKEVSNITLVDLSNKINKLFLMTLFRNPKYVKEINEHSVFARIIDGGFDSEYLAFTSEKMKNNFIKGFRPIPLVNETNKGMITLKALISNLKIDDGIETMIIPFHPKFAIALVPNEHYKKMIEKQGEQTYLLLNNEDNLKLLNKQIYYNAKFNNDDVIGIKDDLNDLLEIIK